MRQWLMDFLLGLEAAAPPDRLCHHALLVTRYGSDETGWEKRMSLQMSLGGGTFRIFFLDPEDFEKSPQSLVSEVVALLEAPAGPKPGNE
jgi:hypothetical protein